MKLIKRINKWWRDYRNESRQPTKDIVQGRIVIKKAITFEPGQKVITHNGYGSIISESKGQLVIGEGDQNGPRNYPLSDKVKQFFVRYNTPSGLILESPLSFSDYGFIDQNTIGDIVKIKITDKKFAKLVPEEEEKLAYVKAFNTKDNGKEILKKLKKEGYIIIKK